MTTVDDAVATIGADQVDDGLPAPLGVAWVGAAQAYNFAIYSRHGASVTLLLYHEFELLTPAAQYTFDATINRSGPIWHCRIPAHLLASITYYAYRVDGLFNPSEGHRFDPQKVLLDPFARRVFFPPAYSRARAAAAGPTAGCAPLGYLPPQQVVPAFDWGETQPPRHTHDLIVYELHVKGFTASPTSGVTPALRGTFAGLTEKIAHIQELGVTAVELLPIHQFDPQENNYWGYMTLNFFAPHHDYVAGDDPHAEFCAMVRAFHAAGIQVWLDVVYNHTSEGDQNGPAHSYRGIDNKSYYLLTRDRRFYINDTGCGNTLRCAHPIVRELMLDSLRYYTEKMGIDGFRFDLVSILTRETDGSINQHDPAAIAEISAFGHYSDATLVAEAWDMGSYQLGLGFPGKTWLQWNGKFRDDVRSFVRGDGGFIAPMMQRLYGSDDLFPDQGRHVYRPSQSVNFVTAHDGFCLYDLTAYNLKHNLANGHNNTDGSDDNRSWNSGFEGDTGAPAHVMTLRRRQVQNFFTILMLANGTPMFCAGDEFLQTQGGNNNPYNQDNQTTWLDWSRLDQNPGVLRFFKRMIAFRKAHPSIGRRRYWREDVRWFGPTGAVDASETSHALAYVLRGAALRDSDLYVMINAGADDLVFAIQDQRDDPWLRVVDTARASPEDICETGEEPVVTTESYHVAPRSVVVLRRPYAGVVGGSA